MIFDTPSPIEYDYDQVSYTSPPPRCSLDFSILTDAGKTINDTQIRLQSFQGHEALSQPFEFNLELRANDYTSGGPDYGDPPVFGALLKSGAATTSSMNFDNIVGANATIMLGTPETGKDVDEGSYPNKRPVVFFNGIISNFALADRGVYHATMKPALFKLGLQNNYRLFSQCTILEIVIKILSENNISFNKSELEKDPNSIVLGLANYRKQDWLQAGESDLDFLNRLMHKVNLFYYFVHSQFSHTMIITDQPYYQSIYQREINKQGFNAETDQLKTLYLSYTQQASLDRDDYITQFKYQQNMITAGITTVLAQKEATWESQNTAQVSPVFLNIAHQKEKLNMEQLHLVQYGATETEISKLTDTAVNQLAAAKFDFSGSSGCAELKAGHKFQVKETWQDPDTSEQSAINKFTSPLPIRPLLDKRVFVATSVQHNASAAGDYKNQFSAVAAEGLATPFHAQGNQQGNILAIVTDKPATETATVNMLNSIARLIKKGGEIIHQGSAAKYLKKNVFSFDSKDFQYENSSNKYSCRGIYVRFIDQPNTASGKWVKLAEHMQTIPEIGSYVVVGRSSDDNEIPEVQQSLQAKGSKVIMPEKYTCHTNVGNSYNTNYGDSTSISFGADVSTPLATAKNIVDTQRKTNNYNDVRYGESSSYSYNVTARSHNISMTGAGSAPNFNPSNMMEYVSFGYSTTNGNTYNESHHQGDSTNSSTTTGNINSSNTVDGNTTNYSKNSGTISSTNIHHGMNNSASTHSGMTNSANNMNGMTNSASNTNGMTTSAQNYNGVNNSINVVLGMENNASTKTGVFLSAQNINGIQGNVSLVTGSTSSTSTTMGNTTNTNTVIGNVTNITTITGLQTTKTTIAGITVEDKTVTAETINEDIASSTRQKTILSWAENQMIASKTGAETTAADNSVTSTQADNSVESTTAQNTVSNVSAGTTTSNDSSLITEVKTQHTELVSATKVVL